jgi:hypothetical protein
MSCIISDGTHAATLVHTLGYLIVTAAVAMIVYQKVGLAMLRKAWFNLDLVWAVALIATGCVALMLYNRFSFLVSRWVLSLTRNEKRETVVQSLDDAPL